MSPNRPTYAPRANGTPPRTLALDSQHYSGYVQDASMGYGSSSYHSPPNVPSHSAKTSMPHYAAPLQRNSRNAAMDTYSMNYRYCINNFCTCVMWKHYQNLFFFLCVHVCIYFNWYLSLISLLLYHNSLTSMKSTARNFFVVVQFILHLESLHHVLNSFECFSSFSACFRLRINSCTFHFNMTNILSVQIMVLFCKGLYVNRYNIFNIFLLSKWFF